MANLFPRQGGWAAAKPLLIGRRLPQLGAVIFLLVALLGACAATAHSANLSHPAPLDTSEILAPSSDVSAPEVATQLHETEQASETRGQLLAKGFASWYASKFQGRRTASGERYDKNALTAAHKTLPFGTLVRVKSLHSGKEVVVRINDRGPFTRKRVIDLSGAAAAALGIKGRGIASVVLLRE
jgi:rare lipoprotein A